MPESDSKRRAILKIRSKCQGEFRAAAAEALGADAAAKQVDSFLMKMARRRLALLPQAVKDDLMAGREVPVDDLRAPVMPEEVPPAPEEAAAPPAAQASQGSASSQVSAEAPDGPDKSKAPTFAHRVKGQLACAKNYRQTLMQDHFAVDVDFA